MSNGIRRPYSKLFAQFKWILCICDHASNRVRQAMNFKIHRRCALLWNFYHRNSMKFILRIVLRLKAIRCASPRRFGFHQFGVVFIACYRTLSGAIFKVWSPPDFRSSCWASKRFPASLTTLVDLDTLTVSLLTVSLLTVDAPTVL